MQPAALDAFGRPRVAITGVGVKTPAGQDVDSFWAGLLAGRSMAAQITDVELGDLPIRMACQVKGFDPTAYLGAKESRRVDRVAQLGLAAAADALGDAGPITVDPARCAVVAGTGIGGITSLDEQEAVYLTRGASRVSPFLIPMMMPNATAALIGMQFGWTGPNFCVATACAAGSHALGEGARLIRDGSADVVIAGGSEACIRPIALAAFHRMGAMSARQGEPERASRPFDADRDGFVMGEGAAFVVLERLDQALARRAKIWGQLSGYGRNADAYHVTAPSPGGAGATACIQAALQDASVEPAGIGHVNAHGTSTPLNDAAEAEAIVKVFGEDAPPVTSIKGVTGHLIGAAGAAEAVASLLALNHGLIPPTANHERTDPAIALDVVAGGPRSVVNRPVLSTSFGFGGHNAALVLSGAAG
jgi:3-oxoacyl-[acyl-carrier-protein] synthase II